MTTNEDALSVTIKREIRSLADLFGEQEIANLARAWQDGLSRAFPHPLIEALHGEAHEQRRKTLDSGLRTVREQGNDLLPFVKRLTLDRTGSAEFTQAVGAMNELWVASACAASGANVRFEATAPGRTPDLVATIDGCDITLEVTSVCLPDEQVKKGNAVMHDFRTWKAGRKAPKTLRGRAHERGGVRTLCPHATCLMALRPA